MTSIQNKQLCKLLYITYTPWEYKGGGWAKLTLGGSPGGGPTTGKQITVIMIRVKILWNNSFKVQMTKIYIPVSSL